MLYQHYQTCLEARLGLWLEDAPPVAREDKTLVIKAERALRLDFQSADCYWTLHGSAGLLDVGSFDQVTKTARKLLSGLLSEEEAEQLTRTSGRMGRRAHLKLSGDR